MRVAGLPERGKGGRCGGLCSSATMPAAAGDGLLSEPPAASFGDGGDEPTTPPLSPEGTFLAAWVNATASRERLREFQHTKRVGNYLIGRKLGEGSFAKVREGLHVVTGEKVPLFSSRSRAGIRPLFPPSPRQPRLQYPHADCFVLPTRQPSGPPPKPLPANHLCPIPSAVGPTGAAVRCFLSCRALLLRPLQPFSYPL